MEEMWSRQLVHMFVSPLRPHELVVSHFTMAAFRVVIGVRVRPRCAPATAFVAADPGRRGEQWVQWALCDAATELDPAWDRTMLVNL